MKSLPKKTGQLPAVRDADAPLAPLANAEPLSLFQPWFSFHYAHQEMQMSGDGLAHVKSKKVQFADGRLESEAFEGTLPAAAYENFVQDAQRLFADQAALLIKQFSCFLPLHLSRTRQDDGDT